ncbi:related to Spindle pole body component SPC98 [Zygosaccharomyces bailii ISA1307]|uniref:Spindle pole body component n=1 Tax=Zygosaccharomyces bailii (strain CLIB 213 / ATCC 58445 / CBS 680 / BCRC 21525 / NBRC 1098 / NCYC 1416 / NRRL Y-2227) TaxID=1333698 RepID=A0A8J2TBN0_ZYGB2|nr:ZYBA0S12-00386g1_1 [Zygosaccharomyces bailii CLIB 213]CDH11133.1 related to Spindle pole body component SPC98 [Zygosaccharomyces bailii ISA1307]
MDLEVALYPVVEALAPHSLPDGLIGSLTREFARLLQSPSMSHAMLQAVVDSFKLQAPYSPDGARRWQKLTKIIESLHEIGREEDRIKYLSTFQSMVMENSSIPSPEYAGRHVSLANIGGLDGHDKLLSPLRPMSLQAESFENLDKLSDRRSLLSSQRGYALNREYNNVSLSTLASRYYLKMISEEDMLKVISYTLLATTTELFQLAFNKITIPNGITNSESGLLHSIFEAVLIYQNLKFKIDEQKHNKSISPMKKALIIQVESELQKYVKVVNGLSAYSRVDSLKQLYFELYDHIIALRFHFRYMETFEETSGDAFLSHSDSLRLHGDVIIRRICTKIFKSLLSFYFEYLINWLTMGKLEATYHEFFIVATDYNSLCIRLEPTKIPGFVPRSVADEIYIIGKTFLFLSRYCRELHRSNEISKKYSLIYRSLCSEAQLAEFYDTVHTHYQEIVRFTNDTLLHKFYYKQVVFVLKDILLMGKGDLIDILIQKAEGILGMPSASLSGHRLTRLLQEAVQQSSLSNLLNKIDENHVVNGLDARILDLGHGSLGWDVFTLDYVVDTPLSVVLNVNRDGGKKEYLRIFNLLWRFKKNDYFYNKEWLNSNQLVRNFKKMDRHRPLIKDLLSKLSRINVLRTQVQNFSYKVESFCFRCIIDKSFQEFEKKLIFCSNSSQNENELPLSIIKLKNGALMLDGILRPHFQHTEAQSAISPSINIENTSQQPNIDELDSIHDEYLNNILSHKLLSSGMDKKIGAVSGQPYASSLIFLLNMAFEFITFHTALNDVAHEVFIQLNLNSQQHLDILLSRFNSVLRNIVSRYKMLMENLQVFARDLKKDGDEELGSLSRSLS